MAPQPPSQYQQYVTDAAQATGIPVSVVAAQANTESGFNPNAVSPAGAEGFWQFMPQTYNSVAGQAGIPQNTEFNVADETKAYITYMNQLLAQEGGSVFKALEAYNAGPGNLNAGSAYAKSILNAAGQSQNLKASPNATTTSDSIHIPNPLNIPGDIGNAIGGTFTNMFKGLFNAIGTELHIPSFTDLLQRLGLILLGVALIIVGLMMISKESGATTVIANTAKKTGEAAAVA